jgi:membrane protein YdbS with pleckstrin-like domain
MKPGYKTTEFWLCLAAAMTAGGLGYLQSLDAPWAVASVTIISAVYAVMRAALKAKEDRRL